MSGNRQVPRTHKNRISAGFLLALVMLMGAVGAIAILTVNPTHASGEDSVTLSWTGGTGALANENPQVTYVYLGGSYTVALSQTPKTYQVDDGTKIEPQTPWVSNAVTFAASPASATASPSLTQNFAYSSTSPSLSTDCTQDGTNVTKLFESGNCLVPAVVWSFGNVLGEPILLEFFVIIPGIVTYIKPRSGVLALVMIALIQGGMSKLIGVSTPITLTLVAVTAVLTLSGSLIKLLWGGGSNQ